MRLDVLTALVRDDGAKWRGAGIAGSVDVCDGSGRPGVHIGGDDDAVRIGHPNVVSAGRTDAAA
eukprot:5142876-Pleurochrysis_carterae.AAC.1